MCPWFFRRRLDGSPKTRCVASSDSPPMFVQFRQLSEPDAANRCLNFVEAKIVTDQFVNVLGFATMVPQHLKFLREHGVVRCNAAAIAHDREILRRKE